MVSRSMKLAVLAFLATGLQACQRQRHMHGDRLYKRSLTTRAPLTADESVILDSFDNNSIADWAYYYTHEYHIAGYNNKEAQWTADRWAEAGLASRLDYYDVFLNYPVDKSLVVTWPNGSTWTPDLEEAVLPEDPTTGRPDRIPTFHGYSFSGSASGEYVYVGRGQKVDYDRLVELGIDLEGKIALAMYGGPFRGLKVKNAQEHGMVGAVLFTDPVDDGEITTANGYAAYPDGPARNPTSVQRGSVQFLSTYPGDPTTPGYPSINDPPRTDGSIVKPMIPSIPISLQNAEPLLAALDGYGFTNRTVGRPDWVGALDATYASGPAPGASISMMNQMEDTFKTISNAIGVINGTNPDETVVIGNHRDAWIVGGAADPNSGSAVIVELGVALGKLLQQGWKPQRNIVLCSWDAEEYGLVGSTEWVEEFIPWLSGTVVSYLNIDVAVSGPHPSISASPELHAIATETMKKIMWPAMGGDHTMYDIWVEDTEGEVGVLGSGSDYTAFLHKGMASIDMGSDGDTDTDPIYQYHTNYDSYYWMDNFGDPEFNVHKAMGQYLTLLGYHLSSDALVPLNPLNYARQMDLYYEDLLTTIADYGEDLDTSELRAAIDTFRTQAQEAKAQEVQAADTGDSALLQLVNTKYRDFQRGFTSQGGLPNREFYQHVVFAPGLDTGYAPVTFPGITEALLNYDNITMAAEWVIRTSAGIRVAGSVLGT